MKHETPETMLRNATMQLIIVKMGLSILASNKSEVLLEHVEMALDNVKRAQALLTNSGEEGKPLV